MNDTRVGFIGLGDQGAPMARRLLERSWPVGFVARRPGVVDEFTALGGTHHQTVADLAKSSNVVLVVVVDDAQLEDVAIGQGLIDTLASGSVIVVHSTVHPDTCRRLAELACKRGIELVDAPVTGGPLRTRDGTLTMPIGCEDPATLERVRPVLEVLASTVERMGPVGTGQATKLLNNFFYCAHSVTAYDTENLVDHLGIDRVVAARLLPTGSGSSDVLRQRATGDVPWRPLNHAKGLDYADGVMAKDVALFLDLARARGVDMQSEFSESLHLVQASLRRGLPPGTPYDQPGVDRDEPA